MFVFVIVTNLHMFFSVMNLCCGVKLSRIVLLKNYFILSEKSMKFKK